MSFSVMRRLAGLVLALVWSGARLAQPLQPDCPHHAATVVTVATPGALTSPSAPLLAGEHLHHVVQGEPAALSETAPTEHQHAPDRPCECAAHCCAASSVAIAVDTPELSAPAVVEASAPLPVRATRAPIDGVPHRQPPATAPPARLAV